MSAAGGVRWSQSISATPASRKVSVRHSLAKPKLLQVGGNRSIQFRGLGLLLAQYHGKALHLFLERLAVVLLRLRADKPTGREHVAMRAHLVERRALAEAGHIRVVARIL